jgi:hypothetical protein
MKARIAFLIVALVALAPCAPARADDGDQQPSISDTVFLIGKITGAATLCKVAVGDINALVGKAFQALDLTPDQGSDSYKRFAEGVTAGGKEVSGGKLNCKDAIANFNDLQQRFQ